MEWRIEFPEILEDESGRFIGFDVIIGNPSYISTKEISEEYKEELKKNFGFADDTYNHFLFL
nr:Eco57I restriction-modification methylase domain-containing protein [Bergeyella cardium]